MYIKWNGLRRRIQPANYPFGYAVEVMIFIPAFLQGQRVGTSHSSNDEADINFFNCGFIQRTINECPNSLRNKHDSIAPLIHC